jgi:hypothetical protein
VDGPDFDVIYGSGLELTATQHDQLCEFDWQSIVDECHEAEVIEEDDFEGGPGMSDTYYWVDIGDPARFLRQLRQFQADHLNGRKC